MIDKIFVYFGRPQIHLNRSGIIMVHIPKQHMGSLEIFLVAAKEGSSQFKIYKKYELDEVLYISKSKEDNELKALFQKIQRLFVDTCQIHIRQADSRAKFRRKVKSWMRKLESHSVGYPNKEKEKIHRPYIKKSFHAIMT